MTWFASSNRRPISTKIFLERRPNGPRHRDGARRIRMHAHGLDHDWHVLSGYRSDLAFANRPQRPGRGRFRVHGSVLAGDDQVAPVVVVEVGVELTHERDAAAL